MSRATFIPSMLAPDERTQTYIAAADGARLELGDGRRVVDGGSLSSCIVGHRHPRVVAAVQKAAEAGNVGDGSGWLPREQAADDLLNLAFEGEDWARGVAFFVSSSEACDLGLLLAQTLTGREPLVARDRGYHGGVGLARSVSLNALWKPGLAPLGDAPQAEAPERATVRKLPVPECGLGTPATRDPDHDCSESCLRDAPALLEGAAAALLDSSQGSVCPPASYQDGLIRAAHEAGAYFIADETVTGFGRLGKGFAFQRGTERPDIVQLGKGITGGAAPGGALVLSEGVLEAIGERRWTTSSTFRGHPLTVAAISATMHIVRDEGLVERSARLGEVLAEAVEEMVATHPSVLRAVGDGGLMRQLQLNVPDEWTEARYQGGGAVESLPHLVHREALDRGAYIGVFSGQTVWAIPPLVIGEDELGKVIEALDGALGAADRALEGVIA
ncbi:MAG TPA: aminotransferase class III-fold pyridoxal phosphate-dependent enzyme [Solirubrobacterales bacterium]